MKLFESDKSSHPGLHFTGLRDVDRTCLKWRFKIRFLEYKNEPTNLASFQALICSGKGKEKGVSTGGWVGFIDDS